MYCTTASYKLTFGVAKTMKDRMVSHLRTTNFSLNLDEATNNNQERILTILACFYNKDVQDVALEHLASIELLKVDAELVFAAVKKVVEESCISWNNLMSILMDSCGVMRGSKTGLRQSLVPHLMDIVHNISSTEVTLEAF